MGAAWFLLLFLSTTTAAAEVMDDGESFIDLMDTNSDYVGGGGPKSRERAEALLVVGGGTPVPLLYRDRQKSVLKRRRRTFRWET